MQSRRWSEVTDGELPGSGLRGRQRIGRVDASPDEFTTRPITKECILFIIITRFCIMPVYMIYSIFSDFFFKYSLRILIVGAATIESHHITRPHAEDLYRS